MAAAVACEKTQCGFEAESVWPHVLGDRSMYSIPTPAGQRGATNRVPVPATSHHQHHHSTRTSVFHILHPPCSPWTRASPIPGRDRLQRPQRPAEAERPQGPQSSQTPQRPCHSALSVCTRTLAQYVLYGEWWPCRGCPVMGSR
ncbi:hypothetical protein BGZ61DRAFT_440267 [Ilyonectria robusta]|uniref:uncharacterized protein n=1 Tax=Ilyonectria robusta TaxID=1079257 RepID=UPI001E8E58EA|nr:uncharacterized protein BGZ61DRAFT_440267 [Ilyonectria robusta]KAH8735451.1 hypothetical protein BGZ61DRAFT_440267 [Ilyonectria robusta]